LALVVVMVSKQGMKVTTGAGSPLRIISSETAGLFETQERLEVMTHRTLSLS
jgi:hypothetical protein